MNCEELQCELPDVMDGERTPEQEAHLRSCRACAGLLADLELISREARQLRASEEPSPRVWNSIEIVLRQEGLIHPPQVDTVPVFQRWAPVWLVPIAATFLIALTVARYELKPHGQTQALEKTSTAMVTASLSTQGKVPARLDDDQLLEAVGARSPALRSTYEADLQRVNADFRDAEESAQTNPNDEEAQRYLMDAHEQKAMIYEMALDRSLP
jgi:hypothetical protein